MIKYENATMTTLRVENADSHLWKGQIVFLFVDNFIENANNLVCVQGFEIKIKLQ